MQKTRDTMGGGEVNQVMMLWVALRRWPNQVAVHLRPYCIAHAEKRQHTVSLQLPSSQDYVTSIRNRTGLLHNIPPLLGSTQMRRLCLCLAGAVALLLLRASAAAYPNPAQQTVDASTGRPECGWDTSLDRVCDPERLLPSIGAITELQRLLVAVQFNASEPYRCGGTAGPQVAIALRRTLGTKGGLASSAVAAATEARRLHDEWGVGHAACGDGILLLLALDDRQVYVSTGAGVKRVMTDALIAVMIERMRPSLRAGNVHAALMRAASDIASLFGIGADSGALQAAAAAAAEATKARRLASMLQWAFLCIPVAVMIGARYRQSVVRARAQAGWEEARARLLEIDRAREACVTGGDDAVSDPDLDDRIDTVDASSSSSDAGESDGLGPGGSSVPTTRLRRRRREEGDSHWRPHRPATIPLAARLSVCPICLDALEPQLQPGTTTAAAAAAAAAGASNKGHHGGGVSDYLLRVSGAGATAAAAVDNTNGGDRDPLLAGREGGSSSSASSLPLPRRTIALPCHHRFHLACADKWMGDAKKNTCPVCRAPAYDDHASNGSRQLQHARHPMASNGGAPAAANAPPPAPSTTGSTDDSSAAAAAALPYDHTLDLLFLMQRMSWRYPLYLHDFRLPPDAVLTTPLARHPAFVATEPAVVHAAADAATAAHMGGGGGRGGWSGGGFGGGSSFGGGGGGGSW